MKPDIKVQLPQMATVQVEEFAQVEIKVVVEPMVEMEEMVLELVVQPMALKYCLLTWVAQAGVETTEIEADMVEERYG
ncbi:unnamed protein product [marine sediment metagenome]|uniref:Uncharacterized protein n=1 Tax=marine sediment metagenome TaxID=412755 RepID=X1C2K3_9ZZZZ